MNTLLRKITMIFVSIVFILGFSINFTSAYSLAQPKTGSISVNIKDVSSNKNISDFKIGICKVAKLENGVYIPETEFEKSNISITGLIKSNNSQHAKEILEYVKQNNVTSVFAKTDTIGNASFSNIGQGIYLIFCADNQKLTFSPYIVFLPTRIDNKQVYSIETSPKTEINNSNLVNVSVRKIWDDKHDEKGKRPDKIKVNLFKNGKKIKSAELSKENNWQYEFKKLPKDNEYNIKEVEINNYKANYKINGKNKFTIINSFYENDSFFSGIATGDTLFPIISLIIAVVAIIVLTFAFKRKSSK